MRSAVNLFDHSVRRKSPKYGLRDWPTCRDDVSGFQRSLRRLCALTQQRPSGPGTAQIETQTDVAFGRRRRPCVAAYASNHVTDLRLSFNCGRTYSCVICFALAERILCEAGRFGDFEMFRVVLPTVRAFSAGKGSGDFNHNSC